MDADMALTLAVGTALLAFALWVRTPRQGGRPRRWEGSTLHAHTLLLLAPGAGLFAVAVALSTLSEAPALVLLLVPVFLVAVAMIAWGLLLIRIPGWFLPADVRQRRGQAR